jgi:uncharacterized paraquat-inducible protein A
MSSALRVVPPIESRAVWCTRCRSLVRTGLIPIIESAACYRCTSPNMVTWRETLRLVAIAFLLLGLALSAALMFSQEMDRQDYHTESAFPRPTK